MKLTKNNLFIALLLLAITFNTHKTHTMEPIEPKQIGWVALAGATILGGYVAYRQFLSYIHEEPFDFEKLPRDIQQEIIILLAQNNSAQTIEEATAIIRALTQTNKQLNDLINDPQFCLRIIKNLAKQFNCSDREAAETLRTKRAKEQLNIQNLLNLCYHQHNENQTNALIKSLIEQGVDLSFSTKSNFGIMAGVSIPAWFSFYGFPDVIKSLITHGININEQTSDGSSVLLYVIRTTTPMNVIEFVPVLLAAGADPELANYQGLTPLQAAQATGNQEIIDLIQNAIDRKQGK